jgi:hypothetical protein
MHDVKQKNMQTTKGMEFTGHGNVMGRTEKQTARDCNVACRTAE